MKNNFCAIGLIFATSFLFVIDGCAPKKEIKSVPEPKIEEEKVSETPEEEEAEEIAPQIPLELKTVYFDFDKYDIRQDAAEILKENAEVLKAYPEIKVILEGHTCDIGTEEYNMALGERRAKSVKDFLSKLGISPDRFSIVSYGETRLVDPLNKPINRRCEFRIK